MKTCAHCSTDYADAQEACPACGRKAGDPLGELVGSFDRSLEEGFGRHRRNQFVVLIVGVLVALVALGLVWFLR